MRVRGKEQASEKETRRSKRKEVSREIAKKSDYFMCYVLVQVERDNTVVLGEL
jgi:hypothetical protein